MVREVIWTKRANRKFNNIIEFLESEWGETVARNFVKRTYDIIDLISVNAEMGSMENKEKDIRGFLLTKHNRVFYRITEKGIVLLNFFDTRSGPKRKRI